MNLNVFTHEYYTCLLNRNGVYRWNFTFYAIIIFHFYTKKSIGRIKNLTYSSIYSFEPFNIYTYKNIKFRHVINSRKYYQYITYTRNYTIRDKCVIIIRTCTISTQRIYKK